MKKGLWLSFAAVLFVGIVVYALWYIDRRGELQNNSKDSFIPYNSAVVVNINPGCTLPPDLEKAFAQEIRNFQDMLLYRTAAGLASSDLVSPTSKVMAVRSEGKGKLVFLFVMDNKQVLSGKNIIDFLQNNFARSPGKVRKYDRYKIYTLQTEDEEMYYAVEEGMVLLSDSEFYIEDALKQFDKENETEQHPARYRQINKYFSASAGINVFLNTSSFSELLPMFLQTDRLFARLDVTSCFKWGALDGELRKDGIGLNGFMDHTGQEASFMKTLERQQPQEAGIDAVIPDQASSFFILNLSDLKTYLAALDNYRYSAGLIESLRKRKQEYIKIFGKEGEPELRELLQGEFALVNMNFDEASEKNEGMIVAELKSGSLCKAWLERAVMKAARNGGLHPESYLRQYTVDRGQSVPYYKFPAEDMPAVFWGYLFEGIPARYALVQDNYLILASSEKVMGHFIRSYVHRTFVRDAEWFRKIKTKLSARYNLAYFADIAAMSTYYRYIAKGGWKNYIQAHEGNLPAFTALALQWSNEGEMLYNTLFLSTEKVRENKRPAVLWQTKLGGRVSMKPVPVVNHVTGEREILVQDETHTLYLLNDAGRVLWRLLLDGPINSEIFQVDAFKNGKLQYLFSTPSRLHLVDRNGKYVENFPLTFKADCPRGISLFDYDKNRNYRIFAPCADRQVYLYDVKGKIVKDWKSAKADKEIVTRVNHYRVEDKDYIVYADRYRLYILDRRGKERVKVTTVFDLPENTGLHLTRKAGKPVIAFANTGGSVNLTDFQGKVEKLKCLEGTGAFCLNVADVDDRGDRLIFTAGNRLAVYDFDGKCFYDKTWEVAGLDFPYVYRFSAADIRIGLLDREKGHMLLLDLKDGMSEGFPVNGDSPFSIVFTGQGNFCLYAGVDNGSLIKYKVQR